MTLSTEAWLEQVRATRPPLSANQIALLRPILAPAVPRMRNAAPDRKQERRTDDRITEQERNAS